MDTTNCPECGSIAEVEWRAVMESTDGPIEHAKIRCIQKHWFLLPLASLAVPAEQTGPEPSRTRTTTAEHGVVRPHEASTRAH